MVDDGWVVGFRRRRAVVAAVGFVLVATSACSRLDPGSACTVVTPPFGLSVDLSALTDEGQVPDTSLVAGYCVDDVCRSVRVHLLAGTVEQQKDPRGLFVPDLRMAAEPTARLHLSDGPGSTTRTVETVVRAREVSSEVNPACAAVGRWAAVRLEPDGRLVDVTATSTLPAALRSR